MNLENVRRDYLMGGLCEDNVKKNPIEQLELWMQQAIDANMPDPTAMTLATVDESHQVSQRIVLLKHLDEQGFVFYTNYSSAKAKDLKFNNKVSLHFPWHIMERQVRVCGVAEKLTVSESEEYFHSRPRESQIAALASPQSDTIPSRDFLENKVKALHDQFDGLDIPLPEFWGGYRIVPTVIEFWQGGGNRLHDRIQYTLDGSADQDAKWLLRRLAP